MQLTVNSAPTSCDSVYPRDTWVGDHVLWPSVCVGVFSGFLFISLAASLPHTCWAKSVVFMLVYAYLCIKIYVMKALILYYIFLTMSNIITIHYF